MVAMVLVTHGLGIEDLPYVQRFLRSVFWNLELHARTLSIHETRTSPTEQHMSSRLTVQSSVCPAMKERQLWPQ